MRKPDNQNYKKYRYLAKSTSSSISTSSTYILFLTKLQKRQIPEKGSALLKNDITTSEPTVRMLDALQSNRNHHNYRFVISYYGITKKSGHW